MWTCESVFVCVCVCEFVCECVCVCLFVCVCEFKKYTFKEI